MANSLPNFFSVFFLLVPEQCNYNSFDSCHWTCSYQSTLKQLFQEFDKSDPDDQLAVVTTRIMQALMNNLDGKSKQYKDPALTQLFLMNNFHYIVRSVRRFVAQPASSARCVFVFSHSYSHLCLCTVQKQKIY